MRIDDISVREPIHKKINGGIISGNTKPSESLLESKLTSEFQVSHSPTREAIRQLQTEPVVMLGSSQRAALTKLSKEEGKEIFAIRVILAPYAVELAVRQLGRREKEVLTA